jgi:hypothetical protein
LGVVKFSIWLAYDQKGCILEVLVGDDEQTAKVERILGRFSEATARKAAIMSQMEELAARIGAVREALGNPFFYSGANHGRPENADKSIAKYSGYKSHEPALRLVQGLHDTNLELSILREQLRELGVGVDT